MRIIRYPDALESSFIPGKLAYREKEISTISGLVFSPLMRGLSTPLWIYGPAGVGKTVTVKYLQKNTTEPRIFYENALSHGSMRAILVSVLGQLGKLVPPSGITYKQIFTALSEFRKGAGKSLVIVIDEAAHLYMEPEGIYNLNRAPELYGINISPIYISIEAPEIHSSFRELSGSLRMESLRFRKYDAGELYGIILDRARRSLSDGSWSEETLRYIAESAEGYGSARVAIEVLQKSALIAEHRGSEAIEPDDIRSAISMIDPFVTESKLSELSDRDLITLLAICRILRHSVSTGVKEIVREVRSVSDEFPVRSQDFRVYDSIRRLERLGFIKGKIVGMGDRKGVSKVIQISDIPVSVLSGKIENILSVMAG